MLEDDDRGIREEQFEAGADEIFRVTRKVRHIDLSRLTEADIESVCGAEIASQPDTECERWIRKLDEKLEALGYPLPGWCWGFVDAGSEEWESIHEEHPYRRFVQSIERGEPIPVTVLRDFPDERRRRVRLFSWLAEGPPLTEEWWVGHLYGIAWEAMWLGDPEQRSRAKQAFQAEFQRYVRWSAHLPDARFARQRREREAYGLSLAQEENADLRQEKLKNIAVARQIADEIWKTKRSFSTPNAIAPLVAPVLQEEHGVKAAPATVRREYLKGWKPPR